MGKLSVGRYGRNSVGDVSFMGEYEVEAGSVSHMQVLSEDDAVKGLGTRRLAMVTMLDGKSFLTDTEGRAAIVAAAAAEH